MAKIGFSKKTFGYTKAKLKKEIINSLESDPVFKKEIARVFQQANRRIQNIESKGLISPAVNALNKGDVKGYSKFKVGGLSWNDLKREYAKAVSFLQQPTSTATGAREYEGHIKRAYDLTDDEFKIMAKQITDKRLSASESEFFEKYLSRYKDFTGEFEQTAKSLAGQIESSALSLESGLDNAINSLTDSTHNAIKSLENELNNAFNKFRK